MAGCGRDRNFKNVKVGYGFVIIFGISMIIFHCYNARRQSYKIPTLSWTLQPSEKEWRELLQMVHNVNVSAKNVSQGENHGSRSCQPIKNIFFLKTHKTASSSIMNILFRYGESRNLEFAFPIKIHHFNYSSFFSALSVFGFPARKRQHYNIMCHHMRFSLAQVEEVMPNNTFYFTILRNPVTLMESSFAYFKESPCFTRAKNLETFLSNPSRFCQKDLSNSGYAKNVMTFDLGFNHFGPDFPKNIKLLTQTVDIIFDLVLITEYFDESLVLLKDALCWTLNDVLSFPLNARSDRSRRILSRETQESIKRWNQLDWKLYVYFNNSFWNRVEKFGRERMKKEVEELRKRRAQISEKCLYNQADPNQLNDESLIPYQSGSARVLGYNLKPALKKHEQELCDRLVVPELQYSEYLFTKQLKRATP
ncbi:galactose-3-O-sulfotransferase 2-like isoform X1 [Engystomops pustulosus]|uniref:galactose-3-O-sulfotransferase 2-like isoform X1 n=1 Tax=Engystomops pustulosus TaxID=76066 RepID=UPI003AFB3A21